MAAIYRLLQTFMTDIEQGTRYPSVIRSLSDGKESTNDPIAVLLFLFFGLTIGIIVLQLLSRLNSKIPYTVVIFILGVVCSSISQIDGGIFSQSVSDWVEIDADLMVFIFIPPLIFGEAMTLNWHHVQGAFFPSCLLAGPGVLLGSALMGVFVKFVLPYDWDWNLSMCFASMVAATDTVAVISLLKSAGASQKLTMLIAGESLLNDGTAMVMFTLFFRMIEGTQFSGLDILGFFVYATIGSCSIGVFSGLLIVYWLRSANRQLKEVDVTIQISITLCAAYVVFFITQYVLRISGVLACCGAGVMLAWLAPPIILSRESMHSVWSIVEWMGNTLIFLLAGLIIGHRVLDHVTTMDWLYVLILYFILMVIRLITVACLFPWLKVSNHQCTPSEAMFISWSGLRGALSVALALILESSELSVPSSETSRILFYVGGMATLTLIWNATLAGLVLDYFQLIDDSAIEKQLVITAIKKRLRKKMNKVLVDVSKQLSPVEIEEIRMSCTLLKDGSELDMRTNLIQETLFNRRDQPKTVVYDDKILSVDIPDHSGLVTAPMDWTAPRGENDGTIDPLVKKTPSDDDSEDNAMDDYDEDSNNEGRNSYSANPSQQVPRYLRRQSSREALFEKLSGNEAINPNRTDRVSLTERIGFESFKKINLNRETRRSRDQVPNDATKDQSLPISNPQIPRNRSYHSSYGVNNQHSVNSLRSVSLTYDRLRDSDSDQNFTNYLFPSKNIAEQRNIRIADASRLLSHASDRVGDNAIIQPDLLAYVRGIFLEIVRVKYWHHIERGKLPRLSHSARYLLYSVDVGLDELRHEDGLQDYRCIESHVLTKPWLIRILTIIDAMLPNWKCFHFIARNLGRLEATQAKRNYYILTSFIEAHEHAQKKIHSFIGIEEEEEVKDTRIPFRQPIASRDQGQSMFSNQAAHKSLSEKGLRDIAAMASHRDDNASIQDSDIGLQNLSPEEIKVKHESETVVKSAKELLNLIPQDMQKSIARKQIARTILAKEAEMVKNMMEEGLLSAQHAEEFLKEIYEDVVQIEVDRDTMYKEQAKMSAKIFEARKQSNLSKFSPHSSRSAGGQDDSSRDGSAPSDGSVFDPLIS